MIQVCCMYITNSCRVKIARSWDLHMSRQPPKRNVKRPGRSLYAVTDPSTECFCLVTGDLFARSYGPSSTSPSEPFDSQHCDIVLIELEIMTDTPFSRPESEYLRVAVRPFEANPSQSDLYISLASVNALNTLIRQDWGAKLGLRLKFKYTQNPSQAQLAAVFDWMLYNKPRLSVAVVDIRVRMVSVRDFAALQLVYGSELQIIPGVQAGDVAGVVRLRGQYFAPREALHKYGEGEPSLTAAEEEAERVLEELGMIISHHGLFLDLNSISVFGNGNARDCELVKPARWSVDTWRKGDGGDFTIKMPGKKSYPERTGLIMP